MPRVLCVDAYQIVRDGLRHVLTEAIPGLVFAEAATPQEAGVLLAGAGWDALVLDVNLPGRGGLDLLAEAKRRWPAMGLLVLSAYPEEEFGMRCLQLGADGYVEKSSRSAEIVAAVQKVLGGGKYVTPVLAEQLAGAARRSIGAAPHQLLSARELQVLKLVAAGKTLKEISGELALGERTIATYRARLREKLGVGTNVEITRYALRHDLVD
jgi:DNA-binding NarL/FixJ family response regulator